MALINFRKETSERSDEANWAKALLSEKSGYYLESIEGCNQNADNQVTHLIERARVDYDPSAKATTEDIISSIIALEGEDVLTRKINFSLCYSLPLSYALYCDENENVFLFNFHSLTNIDFVKQYKSYKEFADWIATIKGWKSNKSFREIQDLPFFDRALRKAGTPWPTNIDCFICNASNQPIAILEFQNARNTKVAHHCNNDFFLCKMSSKNQWGYTVYHEDIRRWTSQEILRVQSGLRYLILTWAQAEEDYILKEVDIITIPYFPDKGGKPDWDYINAYKGGMHNYVTAGKKAVDEAVISNKFKTYNLTEESGNVASVVNDPPLSYGNKTFPSIYYNQKELVQNDKQSLVQKFIDILNS
jgi:hypothetical protein